MFYERFESDKFYFKNMLYVGFILLVLFLFLIGIDLLPNISFVQNKLLSFFRVILALVTFSIFGIYIYHRKFLIEISDQGIAGFEFKKNKRVLKALCEIKSYGAVRAGIAAGNLAFKNVDSYYFHFLDNDLFEFLPSRKTKERLELYLKSLTEIKPKDFI